MKRPTDVYSYNPNTINCYMNPQGNDYSNKVFPNKIIELIMKNLGQVDLQSVFLTNHFWKDRVICATKKHISEIENDTLILQEMNLKAYKSKQLKENLNQININTIKEVTSNINRVFNHQEIELKKIFQLKTHLDYHFSSLIQEIWEDFGDDYLNTIQPQKINSTYVSQKIKQHKISTLYSRTQNESKEIKSQITRGFIMHLVNELGEYRVASPNEFEDLSNYVPRYYLGSNYKDIVIKLCTIIREAHNQGLIEAQQTYIALSKLIVQRGGDKEAALFFCNKVENLIDRDLTLGRITYALIKRGCLYKATFYAEKISDPDKRTLALGYVWAEKVWI